MPVSLGLRVSVTPACVTTYVTDPVCPNCAADFGFAGCPLRASCWASAPPSAVVWGLSLSLSLCVLMSDPLRLPSERDPSYDFTRSGLSTPGSTSPSFHIGAPALDSLASSLPPLAWPQRELRRRSRRISSCLGVLSGSYRDPIAQTGANRLDSRHCTCRAFIL